MIAAVFAVCASGCERMDAATTERFGGGCQCASGSGSASVGMRRRRWRTTTTRRSRRRFRPLSPSDRGRVAMAGVTYERGGGLARSNGLRSAASKMRESRHCELKGNRRDTLLVVTAIAPSPFPCLPAFLSLPPVTRPRATHLILPVRISILACQSIRPCMSLVVTACVTKALHCTKSPARTPQ